MASGTTINSVQDALAVALQILESAQEEVVWLVSPSLLSLCMHYGSVEKTKTFIQNGGVSLGIVPISHANIKDVEICLESGEDVRHSDEVHELFMFVGDKQQSISAINTGVHNFTLDTPVIAFWSESSVYAEYLLSSFESVWSHAVPAAQRIQELVGHGKGQR
ncbi:MAG: hypothetical protein ACXVIF_01965 [Halobacteriota archaeon]